MQWGAAGIRRRIPDPWRRPGTTKIGFVSRACAHPPPLPGVRPLPPVRGLALFHRDLLHVQFAITAFPPSTCPLCHSGEIGFVWRERSARGGPAARNWLCFARLPPAPRGLGVPSAGSGQVLARRLPGANWLCFAQLGVPSVPAGRKLGPFCAFGPAGTRSPGPNWLCFARSALQIGFVSHVSRSGVPVSTRARPNWLRFAQSACASRRRQVRPNPRSCRPGLRSGAAIEELALFRTLAPCDGWQRQGLRPWRWSSRPAGGELALFVHRPRPASSRLFLPSSFHKS